MTLSLCTLHMHNVLKQRLPTFLAPGTGLVEDKFSTDGGGVPMVQAVMRAMGSNGEWQMKLRFFGGGVGDSCFKALVFTLMP